MLTIPGWQEACTAPLCLGHTIDHLAFGSFDSDPAAEVFSDFWVSDPARAGWYYYDDIPDAGANWEPLMETNWTFPDIAVGNFLSSTRSDVFKWEGGFWSISAEGRDPFVQIGQSAFGLNDIMLLDLDLDGDHDIIKNASEWQ